MSSFLSSTQFFPAPSHCIAIATYQNQRAVVAVTAAHEAHVQNHMIVIVAAAAAVHCQNPRIEDIHVPVHQKIMAAPAVHPTEMKAWMIKLEIC